jgi:putative lipoprotein
MAPEAYLHRRSIEPREYRIMRLVILRCVAGLGALLIPLAASAERITGAATYRERIALPPDAAFEAVVEDISAADAPAKLLGSVQFSPAGQVPIRFELPYRDADVQPSHRYGVRVRITQKGRLLYTSTQVHPVLTHGAGTTLDMVQLQRVQGPAKPDRTLTNTYWKLTELNGAAVKVVPKQREPHLILQTEGGRVAGSGGCNRIIGSYRLEDKSLSFAKVASTMMACPDGMDQERALFQALERVRSWQVRSDSLDLLDQAGKTVARFVAVDLK